MVFGVFLPGENHPKFIVLKSNPIVVGMLERLPVTLQIIPYHTECIGESEERLIGPKKKKPECLDFQATRLSHRDPWFSAPASQRVWLSL
jgi:hypothetical protein